MSPNDLTEWCAGMPLVLRRPLEAAERQSLTREAQGLRWLGIGAVALYPLLIGAFVFTAARADPRSPVVQGVLAAGGILLLMVCLPVQLLVARDAFRRRRGLGRDLCRGEVTRFARKPGAPVVMDEALLRLWKARLLPADPEAEWWIEVLPGSGRVWRVQGERVRRWIVAPATSVAAPPPGAAVAAQWLEPIARREEATLLGGQREMSAAEQEELRRYARRLWLRPLPFAIGLTLWLAMPVVVLVLEGRLQSRIDWLRFALLAAITLKVDAALARALWLARRLGQDAQERRILIFRADPSLPPAPPNDAPAAARDEVPEGPDPAPPVYEMLPRSRWYWSVSGHPAPWRVVRP